MRNPLGKTTFAASNESAVDICQILQAQTPCGPGLYNVFPEMQKLLHNLSVQDFSSCTLG